VEAVAVASPGRRRRCAVATRPIRKTVSPAASDRDPFGGIYAPEPDAGSRNRIGAWSDEEFYRALHDGVAPDGSRYYPASPILFHEIHPRRTWWRSVPTRHADAFSSVTPPPELRWPLSHRVVMRGWKSSVFRRGTFEKTPEKSEEWNRGAYLVEGAAHCGACPHAQNAFGADRRDQLYGGRPACRVGLRRGSTARSGAG